MELSTIIDIREICPHLTALKAQEEGPPLPYDSSQPVDFEILLREADLTSTNCPTGGTRVEARDVTDRYVQPPFHVVGVACPGCIYYRNGFQATLTLSANTNDKS